jgi:HAD superfamily hydrolase (TIGR01549 family)
LFSWDKISLANVQGLLCDLDNTLYAYEPCNKAGFMAVRHLADEKFNIPSKAFEEYWKEARKIVHKDLAPFGAGHSRLLYAQKVAEQHFGFTHPEFSLLAEETYWSAFLDSMEWDVEAKAFLERAKSSGLDVCIVTDLTAQIQHRKWMKLNLGRYARFMVTSEEAGYEKPQPDIFNLALNKLGMKPDEVIMIGDSLSKDVEGAKALGIRAYHVKRDESC